MTWRVQTLNDGFLRRTREDGLDDLGQSVVRLTAQGDEPCRDALRRARPGEPLILASYSPFRQAGPYREYGPVYLLAAAQPQSSPSLPALLRRAGDDAYLGERIALRAYDRREFMLEAMLVELGLAADLLARWAARPEVASALLRFPAQGCHALRLDRNG
ncbi:hypothetical protein BI347_00785 [Chromobacterium sphagni]|uniref:DUF1203 domain-containing protein n=1 Tax=Chromobacterium sphagni TaxID=1903179 RepID=A0A1S1WZ37_9NEIS|nr:DUF1203 domain-containing protein [Chromobacterium sphagni]OHX12196.1 hypothetical protein BI347_00785 [Chromobacterium sphagni]